MKKDGRNALMIAAQLGNYEVVHFLLEQEAAGVNKRDKYGNSALLLSVLGKGDAETFKLLYNYKGVDRFMNNFEGMNLLICAACRGHHKIVDFLLDQKDTDINATDGAGCTALHHAAGHGNLELFQAVYTHPLVNQKAKSSDGFTALMVACFKFCT